jgi:hypothetical protein
MKKNGKDRGVLRTYRSYNFRDKDPIIDVLRTARSDAGLSINDAHVSSDVSEATIRNWEMGRTRRPQFATVVAVARVYGATGIAFDSSGQPHLLQPVRSTAIYKLPKEIRERENA